MKAGWEVKPLGELCRIELGSTPARKNPKLWDIARETENIWLSIADMPKGIKEVICASKEHVSNVAASSMKVVPKGTLMVSFKLTLGRLAFAGTDLRTNEAIAALHDLDSAIIEKEYLYWFLTFFDWQGAAKGEEKVKGKTLNKAKLNELSIIIPPLDEQKRIVAVLDAAFDGLTRARANVEANHQNARELFESYLEKTFNDVSGDCNLKPLADLCDKRGITYGVIKLGEHVPTGIPCLRTSNVRPLRYELGGMKHISSKLSEEYSRTILKGGEVLVNVRGTLGGVCVVPPDMIGWNISREVAMVDLKADGISPDFVALYIATKKAQSWLTGVLKGAAYKGINLIDLRKLEIPSPTLSKQVEIVKETENLREETVSLETLYQTKLADLDELRQSLLQKAFAGELT